MKQLNKRQLALVCGGEGPSVTVSSGTAQAAAVGTSVVAIGSALGADAAITAAGGLGNMGVGAIAANGAYWGGPVGAGVIGYTVGSLAYEHSETVQNVAQVVVGALAVELPNAIYEAWQWITGDAQAHTIDDGLSCRYDRDFLRDAEVPVATM